MSNNNSLQSQIRDLIFFYVKQNYNQYLKDNNINSIPDNDLENVINNLYTTRKEHIQEFIKKSIPQLYKDKPSECPNNLIILNLLNEIFNDDNLCKKRIYNEIKIYQDKKN